MKLKTKYGVYQVDKIYDDCGRESKTETFLGYTMPYSAKQAVMQIRYKLNIRDRDLYRYYQGDGGRISSIVAKEVLV